MATPPLVYSQLRMLAEAAAGIPNGELTIFRLNPPGTAESPPTNILGPEIVPAEPWPTEGVVVPARHQTKFPQPEGGVVVQVTGASGQGVNAVDCHADALFWSDAAVQKFVLPYYASCMGYEAYERLRTLEEAWNGSHPGIRVIALMHVTGAPVNATAPTPVEPFWVVYLQEDENQVVASSLSDFSRANPATLPRLERPAPAPYNTLPPEGINITPRLDYVALRAMAEWAAALGTQPMYFTYDPATGDFGPPAASPPAEVAIVIPALNPFVPADRLGGLTMTVTFGGVPLPDDADAVFWSTGAIEQFLMSYYASIDGFNGLPDLQALAAAWEENIPTRGGNLLVGTVDQAVTGVPDGEITGILHFLRSMYETDPPPLTTTGVRRELGIVQRSPAGTQIIRPSAVTATAV